MATNSEGIGIQLKKQDFRRGGCEDRGNENACPKHQESYFHILSLQHLHFLHAIANKQMIQFSYPL